MDLIISEGKLVMEKTQKMNKLAKAIGPLMIKANEAQENGKHSVYCKYSDKASKIVRKSGISCKDWFKYYNDLLLKVNPSDDTTLDDYYMDA